MTLLNLTLRNFRNFDEARIEFSPHLNLIQGENAQGKTNLLEAIYFLSTGRSFRTTHIIELIKQGKEYFYLEAEFQKDGLTQTLRVSFDGKEKRVQHNSSSYSNFSSLLGHLPVVIYVPEDIALLMGPPQERRRFLDLHIAQIDPLYVHHLMRYLKALKQRNHLLKQKTEEGMEIWEQIMTTSALYLIQKRKEMIHDLSPLLSSNMQQLSHENEILEIHYQTSDLNFKAQRSREMHYGNTLIGPHRDDCILTLNQQRAKIYCSEGQKRCCVAALRLSEWQHLTQILNHSPLVCIDDFGVHLDAKRSELLKERIKGLSQTFLTSPYFNGVSSPTIEVKSGNLNKACRGEVF